MDNPYDIYISAHIDDLKRENRELREKWQRVCHENSLLCAEVDKLKHEKRQAEWQAEWQESFEWMNEC